MLAEPSQECNATLYRKHTYSAAVSQPFALLHLGMTSSSKRYYCCEIQKRRRSTVHILRMSATSALRNALDQHVNHRPDVMRGVGVAESGDPCQSLRVFSNLIALRGSSLWSIPAHFSCADLIVKQTTDHTITFSYSSQRTSQPHTQACMNPITTFRKPNHFGA